MKVKTYLKEYRSLLKQFFVPKAIKNNIRDIDLFPLFEKGYRHIFLDLDNTVLAMSERKISLKFLHWIEEAKVLGFDLYFVSNNSSHKRVESACVQAKLKGIYFACKPFIFSTRQLMKSIGTTPNKVIIIGDQLFTDVIMANILGSFSILVDPLDKKLSFFKTVQRQLELAIVQKLDR